MRKNGLSQYLLILLLVLAVYIGHSQGNAAKALPPLASSTPFDGGLFLLLAAGVIYGGKVLYRKD